MQSAEQQVVSTWHGWAIIRRDSREPAPLRGLMEEAIFIGCNNPKCMQRPDGNVLLNHAHPDLIILKSGVTVTTNGDYTHVIGSSKEAIEAAFQLIDVTPSDIEQIDLRGPQRLTCKSKMHFSRIE